MKSQFVIEVTYRSQLALGVVGPLIGKRCVYPLAKDAKPVQVSGSPEELCNQIKKATPKVAFWLCQAIEEIHLDTNAADPQPKSGNDTASYTLVSVGAKERFVDLRLNQNGPNPPIVKSGQSVRVAEVGDRLGGPGTLVETIKGWWEHEDGARYPFYVNALGHANDNETLKQSFSRVCLALVVEGEYYRLRLVVPNLVNPTPPESHRAFCDALAVAAQNPLLRDAAQATMRLANC